ncbi:DnaJ-like protein subfamily C GRV2 [Hibiscus syriacus]|uniref:DnaJ-like protein subfamily C GRV2 n=1 Tax=Hibiscus syriacus TaxID=106335 RepID=A0A6A2Y4R9_HIBSY|nr:DnaJ-like protein subfamily C GRV2 [Hibiscus syriacus]
MDQHRLSNATPPSHEEPEYIARYFVIKHSWRGRYKRILCISDDAIITLDPSTLSVTNSYDVSIDFESAMPIVGTDDNSPEFNMSVEPVGPVAEFPVLLIRRRHAEWALFKLKVTYVGVELIDLKSGDPRWCLDFRDMSSPAIVLLSDAYGKKIVDHGGFILRPLYGRKYKAFQAASGTTNSAIISNLTKAAKSMVGVSLSVDMSQSLTATEYIKQRAKEAVGAAETPCGGWFVTRLRSAARGTLNVPGLSFSVGPKGGLGQHGNAVSRQLILTKASLLERRLDNYERSPRCLQLNSMMGALSMLTMPDHRIDPPCGTVTLQFGQQPALLDVESASMHLKHLSAAAKDAVAEGGSIPGSRAKLWHRIREFNVTVMALVTMLPTTPNLPPESPPLPPPSPKAAATVMGFVACLRRLLASKSTASHIMSFPAAFGRIMGLLRNGSEGVAAEAAGLVASLIGGGPGDTNLLTDSKGEQHATIMHTKSVLFSQQGYVVILVNRLKSTSVSPLLSMAFFEVLKAMICDPWENVAVIMCTIAEEDAIAAESMQEASLRDGALLRHLLHAFFLSACERLEVSRQLVALWADSYQPALEYFPHNWRDRTGQGISSQEQPFSSVNSYEAGDAVRQMNTGYHKVAENYQKSTIDHNSSQVSNQSSAAHTMESLTSDTCSTGISQNGHSVLSRPLMPHQRILDHNRADLIWNERTRQELREALQAEAHKLDVEKECTEDIVPGGAIVESRSGQDSVPRISWNYYEFSVSYRSLSKDVCVGQYYLRLLLESGSSGRAQDFPLQNPVGFFRALYHRFLCDADIGLAVGGAFSDELGSSDDWCDMGRLDGFGGGGGSSVRELCARAMSIVYEQHCNIIIGFSMESCVILGGYVLAVDLLTMVHEASERTAIPLQSNLIAATDFMEPLKEWMYADKYGEEAGPLEKVLFGQQGVGLLG